MSRQVIDAVIIAAVLALAATHLYAQGMGNRKVIHPNQPGVVAPGGVRGPGGANGGPAAGRPGMPNNGLGNPAGGPRQAFQSPGGRMGPRQR